MVRSWFRHRPEEAGSAFPVPWPAGRPGIYGFLSQFEVRDGDSLPAEAHELPDEANVVSRQGSGWRWAPGAMDGVLGHHSGTGDDSDVDRIAEQLARAVNTGSSRAVRKFYESVMDGPVLTLVDPLRTRVAERGGMAPEQLQAFAAWLVTESPDRDALKVGIALLGMVTPLKDAGILLKLGVHDEFTLYVGVALGSLPDAEAEEAQWWLARRVDGWGRIHLVERLAGTARGDIRGWMLRDGYRNSIMNEYLAYTCAVAGGMVEALREDVIDDALLHGAGEILSALIVGGPAEDMSDYADGAEAAQRYLEHLSRRVPDEVDPYLTVAGIRGYAAGFIENDGEATAADHVWSEERRAEIVASADAILADPHWMTLVTDGLQSEDKQVLWYASRAADQIGLDTWPTRFERLTSGDSDQIYSLMRTEDPSRIQQIIGWATTSLDLDKLSTGPAEEMGLGPGYSEHNALGMILQDLGRFPGFGWVLVDTGLRSPVIRNRNMAIKTLQAWPPGQWPPQARAVVLTARDLEPDTDVKQRLNDLLGAPG